MAQKGKNIIEVPAGVTASISGNTMKIKGPKGELTRDMRYPHVSIKMDGNKLVVDTSTDTIKCKSVAGAYVSHIHNMIKGVTEGYVYKMKAVYSHFPMSMKVEGNRVVISNFLGEKAPRHSVIIGKSTKVKIQKDDVTIEGISKEEVGQTAGSLEIATRINNKDTRVFQDGVYILKN